MTAEQATTMRDDVIAEAVLNGRTAKHPARPSPCQVGMVFIWPRMALHLLDNVWHRQRTRRAWKVADYLKAMQNGNWGEGDDEDILIADLVDASGAVVKSFLIDGQHRLDALAKFGQGFWFAVKRKQFRSEHEIGIAYGHRGRGLPRTKTDGLVGIGIAAEFDISQRDVNAASAALDLIIRGFKRVQTKADEDAPPVNDISVRAAALYDWRDQILTYTKLAGGGHATSEMYQVGVESVALVTLRWQPEKAEPFWRKVAEGDLLAKGTAAHTLHGFIYGAMKSEYRKAPVHLRARAVATCWNAHYRDYPLKIIKITGEMLKKAIKIDGTPYRDKSYLLQHYEIEGWTASARGNLK